MIRSLKKIAHLLSAYFANIYFSFPSRNLRVISITGTSGKTTTTHLIYELLKQSGENVSMISTVEARINGNNHDTGFHVTTPSPWELQRFLKKSVDGDTKYFVLETSSHALDQFRTYGIDPYIAVITNISHEHLDYHKTHENYRAAKAKLLRRTKYAVINADDQNISFLKNKVKGKLVTFGIDNPADITPKNLKFHSSLPGKYNVYNTLAAYAVAEIIGIHKNKINSIISNFSGVPGRMEQVESGRNFKIFIDFAHKPDALEKVLETVRKMTDKKVIVIFGCAGLRDRLKRRMMGEIAGKLADYAILTAEDPRTEDVRMIIDEIAKGCLKAGMKDITNKYKKSNSHIRGKGYFRIPDRQEAINYGIRRLAKPGDVVLITGKGHESSMCWGNKEYPWDEKKAIKKALSYDPV